MDQLKIFGWSMTNELAWDDDGHDGEGFLVLTLFYFKFISQMLFKLRNKKN
jgi:hypothetical protein